MRVPVLGARKICSNRFQFSHPNRSSYPFSNILSILKQSQTDFIGMQHDKILAAWSCDERNHKSKRERQQR